MSKLQNFLIFKIISIDLKVFNYLYTNFLLMIEDFKINWSSRSHFYTPSELKIVQKVMKTADTLTKGNYLNKFEKDFQLSD